MKRIIFLFCALVFSAIMFSQAPQGINYQGVARDPGGNALSNASISLEFKIWHGNPSAGGSMIYSELHPTVATDTFGLYTRVIGSASGSGTGSFNSIPWSTGNKWVEVYIDPTGSGSAYSLVSSSQLMSVPYALYAATSGSGGGGGSISGQANNIPRINNAGNGLGRSLIFQSTDSSSIGVNTTSPRPGAILDISSNSKGLLIPRMTDAQRNLITNKHHGLTVFQTNNAGVLSPEGYWYYDSTVTTWLFMAPAQAVWTLSGNYLASSSSFIGSLNNADVIFKTGSPTLVTTERMRILSGTGQMQFGTPGTEYAFPATRGSAGDVLRLDPTGSTNNLVWTPPGTGATTWVRNGGTVTTVNTTDTVGIGTTTPRTTLEIVSLNPKGALNVTNAGTAGGAGAFSIASTSNDSTALIGYTKGGGIAIMGITEGSNHAGAFGILNPASTASGIVSSTNGSGKGVLGINAGTGYGGLFMISNTTNDSAAVAGITSGKGPAVLGFNPGLGNGGFFQITNPTNSKGAIDAITNGTGSAGNFQVSNNGNSAPVLNIGTNGTGNGISVNTNAGSAIDATNAGGGHTINAKNNGAGGNAGNFFISNNSNGNAALIASTSGTGAAVQGDATGNGAAIFGNQGGTGPAVVGYNSGTGVAGSFSQVNTTSNSPALNVTTSSAGGGFSGDFSGGAGMRTDKIRITTGAQAGLMLTSGTSSGDGQWSPVPGSINFGVSISTTAQSFGANTNTVTVNLGAVGYSNPPTLISGNVFTSPSAGFYHFDAQVTIVNGGAMSGGTIILSLQDPVSGTIYKQVQYNAPSGGSFSQSLAISSDVQLNTGQKVVLAISNTSTGTTYNSITNPVLSWFNGHKVY